MNDMADSALLDAALIDTNEASMRDTLAAKAGHPYGFADRLLRNRLLAHMGKIRHGRIVIHDAMGQTDLASMDTADDSQAALRIDVLDPAFYRAVAANGSVGAGESFIEGQWRCDDLVGLIRLLVRNRDLVDDMETGLARLGGWALRAWHALNRNTRGGSRRNIAAHYDLGNAFFSLFLSPDLMYSSAMWAGADDTLEAASRRKLESICQKLRLKPGDRVVEIGTGWGGFAIHAARHHGCHVTTTTISQEQYDMAVQRVEMAGLQNQITLLKQDYRDLTGKYDKLVSIEMIEAIGAPYLDTYFRQIGELLHDDGLALVQAITLEDHRYEQAVNAVDYIKRFIFPGSFIPSINAMLAAKSRAGDLALIHMEDFGLSYARTLEAWRERFMAQLPQVRAQGFDERFIRMWLFYLAYCEGGFRERAIGVSHLVMAKPGFRTQAT